MKNLLALRKKLKSRKPTFKRHDSHKKDRVSSESYRRPKGRQNKMRLHRKGYARSRSTGFGSPTAVRGLSADGLNQVRVENKNDFAGLDPKTDGIIIAGTVGNRRREELLNFASEKKFTVLNVNEKNFKAKLEAQQAAKKEHQKQLEKRKQDHKKAAKKSEKKSEDKSEELSEEDKKLAEKKEHDKVLTQKGDQV